MLTSPHFLKLKLTLNLEITKNHQKSLKNHLMIISRIITTTMIISSIITTTIRATTRCIDRSGRAQDSMKIGACGATKPSRHMKATQIARNAISLYMRIVSPNTSRASKVGCHVRRKPQVRRHLRGSRAQRSKHLVTIRGPFPSLIDKQWSHDWKEF